MASFGRALRKDFYLEPNYIPLNHGSFGVYPREVRKKLVAYQELCEFQPDRFIRIEGPAAVKQNRRRLAALCGIADPRDMAFIQNATSAASTVFRSFPFAQGDKILCVGSNFKRTARKHLLTSHAHV